ncbi:aconitase X catalytic domain-containing protein [Acuticoccus sp. MNP-M23]|uniref:aconitase X catalytic domain-containing protein n=1 Tax=Acuticoccus sp. MNP-M23 TaxID=3072793 RepID=UPI002815ADDA|nr:aconitase X catalytic domain-containing protein [Acuticoccus sp. MNP-M23]WMS43270.1 aconitase X catalytic domain-containing protein [Acuticoccus sp. MNP-M23]
MAVSLTKTEQAMLDGAEGPGIASAMRIVAEVATILGAPQLIPIASAHIDGCLYHGDSGTRFAQHLVDCGARVKVPATLNIGSLDLLNPASVRMTGAARKSALRLMRAYEGLGCRATWTCAPYQAGHRPAAGTDVAWGESNAVVFCNSVLGARTNRYGDFLDIAAAICGRAPLTGLHLPENRRAQLVVDTGALPAATRDDDAAWPVLGALVGQRAGDAVVALTGLEGFATEDRMKAFGAAAAAFGATALFHIIGVTPEAPTLAAIADETAPRMVLTPQDVADGFALLSTAPDDAPVTAIGVGSPHLSLAECRDLAERLAGQTVRLPFYANTGRHVLAALTQAERHALEAAGVTMIADTCIVATPILSGDGVLMTNSGKFAHYAPGNIGHAVVYASLATCVDVAVSGVRR